MSHWFDTPVGGGTIVLLVVALLIAAGFEFVNGFHDTANAVATVIYTNTLKPVVAVLISGAFNFLGCWVGGIAVALAILKLLPVELLASSGSAGMAMVLALLISAILWNIGTWYLGLPASSSHTLIGAIIGVGLANSLMPGHVFGSGVNWAKVHEVGLTLLLSPVFGVIAAALLLLLLRAVVKSETLFRPPEGKKPPPWWIRTILVGTCGGVSFAHGSNDGQKGVGLIMLILIGLLPADFALNPGFQKKHMDDTVAVAQTLDRTARDAFGGDQRVASNTDIPVAQAQASKVLGDLADIRTAFAGRSSVHDIPAGDRFEIRSKIITVDHTLADLEKSSGASLEPETIKQLHTSRAQLRDAVDYAPLWVKILIALSLGIGTMIGWKRIVVTVGEKIGKTHLTYVQGASAELVAAATIGMSGGLGLPVSTTHVLSSGIAGTMLAQKSGLQTSTVRNIAMAWVLTLPAAMLLSGGLFLLFHAIIPEAKAATTPTVHFERGTEEATVETSRGPLRLHGSNTIGAELAPALAEAFLRGRGATDVTRASHVDGHAWVVEGRPANADPVVIEIDAEGSASGFADLAKAACDIGLASRPVTDDEAKAIATAGHGDLTAPSNEVVIGLDGIAVITAPGNPVAKLRTDELARIFSGAESSWPAGLAVRGPIHLYARDDRSGTWDTFRTLVMGDKPLAAGATRFSDGAKLADAVAADPGGIGFVAMAAVRGAHAVPISESDALPVAPTRFSVATEDYPLSRRLFLYLPSPPTHDLAPDFASFALSPEGQLIVAASGFVDLAARTADLQATQACTVCPAGYVAATRGAKRMPINFRFVSGSSDLDSRALQDADRVATFLHDYRGAEIALLGFSDNTGSDDANLAVSRERAKRVADRLAAYGLVAKTVDGFGAQMPVASNDTPLGRQRNRRVEVWLVDGDASAGK